HVLGEARDLLDRNHRHSPLAGRVGGSPGGYDLPTQTGERAGELDDSALVGNRQKRPHRRSAVVSSVPGRHDATLHECARRLLERGVVASCNGWKRSTVTLEPRERLIV